MNDEKQKVILFITFYTVYGRESWPRDQEERWLIEASEMKGLQEVLWIMSNLQKKTQK